MNTPPTTTTDELGDKLRRLATWADRVPRVHRPMIGASIDRLAAQLGAAVDVQPDELER